MIRRKMRYMLLYFPELLARLGIVDEEKGKEAFNLALPIMVTGGVRTLMRTLDFFMVSVAVGSAAIAALQLGFQYYFIGFGLALAVSSGTISVVSRLKGAGSHTRANLAIKQSFWISLLVTIPLTIVTWVHAEAMIDLLTNDSEVIALGGTYLRIVMLSVTCRFWSMIAARALAGGGDTRTPMYVRLVAIPTNIVLNAILIFGLGPFEPMGVVGAAIGTAIANTLAASVFFALLLTNRYPVSFPLRGRQFDLDLIVEIVRVGSPLAGTRLIRTFGQFPFLFLLALLGTEVVAAYAIAKRIVLLAFMPAWGYGTAASTLVGQQLGADEENKATEYGWETLRLGVCTHFLVAGVLFVLAVPITSVFGTKEVGMAAEFVRVFAITSIAFGIERTMRGGLRGAGDMKWPLYGTAVATVVKLGVAALSIPAGATVVLFGLIIPGYNAGLLAVYAAIILNMYIKALVNTTRFKSGRWKQIAAESRVGNSNE